MPWDALWLNAHLATMATGRTKYGAIRDAALGIAGGRIAWVGRRADLPGRPEVLATAVHDAGGQWITPGLIDCHTHIVYGGNRAHEFEMRVEGASYTEIAKAGGGILSTVRATRAAAEAELLEGASRRVAQLASEGVTALEIKSGYGLDRATEEKQLRVARRLGERFGLTVRTTYLAAHTLPEEYSGRADDYIAFVCEEGLPQAAKAGLIDAVDAFLEKIAFNEAQTRRLFERARALGLPVKLHADQLSDGGGAATAAAFDGLSADHLEYTSDAGVAAMAAAGTVAVLLPGAFYFLRETKLPPIAALRRAGVPMALSTDCNPGSSPVTSLLLMLNMGCTVFRLTAEEVLHGVTRNAASALGLTASHGTLEVGKAADFVLWRIAGPAELAYAVGANPCTGVVGGGRPRVLARAAG
ncbi:MAG: imidazolonepropionase [Alphaproteobacteria bacterium]|nr:imidazolonepropionase [Alphaproteobacteria bacterium]